MEPSIRELVTKAVQEVYGVEVVFAVEQPKDLTHGDYSTNVALILAKLTKVGPTEIAQKLVDLMSTPEVQPPGLAEISVAGIGFINFTLAKEFFSTKVREVISKGDEWGKSSVHAGKHILVEHSSPNLFKPFHIGHVMNNAIGESIDRLAKFSGAEVKTISFPSDISLGLAKAIFILIEKYGEDFKPTDIAILGDAYVEGTKRYEDDESVQSRVKEIADNLYTQNPSPEWTMYERCKSFNIEYFERITARLGSHFDDYIYESQAGVKGKEIVLQNTPAVFTESEGAIVYVPEEDRKDINTAVFINSQGNPTYEAKDIGLLSMKFSGEPLDFSIFITDNQQVPHFQVVLAAAHKIQSEWSEKSIHVHHGRMSFKGQKMSSRLGGVPLAETVIDTVSEEVKEKALRDAQGLRPIDIDAIAIAALKFSILRAAAGKDINFDPETSLSFEGDSGPYLQYSTVRANSILTKSSFSLNTEYLTIKEWQTTEVEKLLIHFPEVVERAIQEWSPHFIVTYLLELAQAFNSWYGNTKIIDDSAESPYKLALTKAFAQTMTNGLTLLGISVPEKM
ncbi:MAG TPA: arginine--tRNA ligase [Candidatus Paceibacterota bacterium]|jgi:arginyl-tRNA synthetase|nr:arginine--tRNA ligase [Candidatus Paceibacterota bacterium]